MIFLMEIVVRRRIGFSVCLTGSGIALLLVLAAAAVKVPVTCSNHCSSCKDVSEDQCIPGTVFRVDGDACGCCDACVILKGRGEDCSSLVILDFHTGTLDLTVASVQCDSRYECAGGICREKIGHCNPSETAFSYQPACAAGSTLFARQQCNDTHCFCVDPYLGVPYEYTAVYAEDASKSVCKCTAEISHHQFKGALVDEPHARCDAIGNYQEVQCSSWHCWCVDPLTGEHRPGTKVQLPPDYRDIMTCEQLLVSLSPMPQTISSVRQDPKTGALIAHLVKECKYGDVSLKHNKTKPITSEGSQEIRKGQFGRSESIPKSESSPEEDASSRNTNDPTRENYPTNPTQKGPPSKLTKQQDSSPKATEEDYRPEETTSEILDANESQENSRTYSPRSQKVAIYSEAEEEEEEEDEEDESNEDQNSTEHSSDTEQVYRRLVIEKEPNKYVVLSYSRDRQLISRHVIRSETVPYINEEGTKFVKQHEEKAKPQTNTADSMISQRMADLDTSEDETQDGSNTEESQIEQSPFYNTNDERTSTGNSTQQTLTDAQVNNTNASNDEVISEGRTANIQVNNTSESNDEVILEEKKMENTSLHSVTNTGGDRDSIEENPQSKETYRNIYENNTDSNNSLRSSTDAGLDNNPKVYPQEMETENNSESNQDQSSVSSKQYANNQETSVESSLEYPKSSKDDKREELAASQETFLPITSEKAITLNEDARKTESPEPYEMRKPSYVNSSKHSDEELKDDTNKVQEEEKLSKSSKDNDNFEYPRRTNIQTDDSNNARDRVQQDESSPSFADRKSPNSNNEGIRKEFPKNLKSQSNEIQNKETIYPIQDEQIKEEMEGTSHEFKSSKSYELDQQQMKGSQPSSEYYSQYQEYSSEETKTGSNDSRYVNSNEYQTSEEKDTGMSQYNGPNQSESKETRDKNSNNVLYQNEDQEKENFGKTRNIDLEDMNKMKSPKNDQEFENNETRQTSAQEHPVMELSTGSPTDKNAIVQPSENHQLSREKASNNLELSKGKNSQDPLTDREPNNSYSEQLIVPHAKGKMSREHYNYYESAEASQGSPNYIEDQKHEPTTSEEYQSEYAGTKETSMEELNSPSKNVNSQQPFTSTASKDSDGTSQQAPITGGDQVDNSTNLTPLNVNDKLSTTQPRDTPSRQVNSDFNENDYSLNTSQEKNPKANAKTHQIPPDEIETINKSDVSPKNFGKYDVGNEGENVDTPPKNNSQVSSTDEENVPVTEVNAGNRPIQREDKPLSKEDRGTGENYFNNMNDPKTYPDGDIPGKDKNDANTSYGKSVIAVSHVSSSEGVVISKSYVRTEDHEEATYSKGPLIEDLDTKTKQKPSSLRKTQGGQMVDEQGTHRDGTVVDSQEKTPERSNDEQYRKAESSLYSEQLRNHDSRAPPTSQYSLEKEDISEGAEHEKTNYRTVAPSTKSGQGNAENAVSPPMDKSRPREGRKSSRKKHKKGKRKSSKNRHILESREDGFENRETEIPNDSKERRPKISKSTAQNSFNRSPDRKPLRDYDYSEQQVDQDEYNQRQNSAGNARKQKGRKINQATSAPGRISEPKKSKPNRGPQGNDKPRRPSIQMTYRVSSRGGESEPPLYDFPSSRETGSTKLRKYRSDSEYRQEYDDDMYRQAEDSP